MKGMLVVHLRMIEHASLTFVTLWVMKLEYEMKMHMKMHGCVHDYDARNAC